METEIDQQKQFERMTTQPVAKLLARLSVPTIISMMVTNFYNIVDTAFVGTLGTSQSGATGVVFGYMAILQAVGFMCGQGSGSLMARRLGARDTEDANRFASTGLVMSFTLGVILGILSLLCINPLMVMLGSTKTIAVYAKIYITFIILSAPFFTSSLTMNNLLRYDGKAKLGTIGLMVGAVLNICLDALLMFVFKMGIAGAGIATAVSQVVSFSILLSMFLRGRTKIRLSLRYLSKNARPYLNIAATGFPSLLRQGLNSVATMELNKLAGFYNDEAVAGMSIVSRISFFAMAVAIGIGQGFQPISSFNYGAGRKDRVKRAFWCAFLGGEIALFTISVPIFIFAEPLVQLLRNDPEVILIGAKALRFMCIGQLFVPLTMMVEMGFQSTGQRLLAAFGSSLRSGVVFIPTLLVLEHVRGLEGVQMAQPLSFVITFGICLILCRVFMKKLEENQK